MLTIGQKIHILIWSIFDIKRYEFYMEQTAKGLSLLQSYWKACDTPNHLL